MLPSTARDPLRMSARRRFQFADPGLGAVVALAAVAVLEVLRQHNPPLFDFVLKRQLPSRGSRFSPAIFETRTFFERKTA